MTGSVPVVQRDPPPSLQDGRGPLRSIATPVTKLRPVDARSSGYSNASTTLNWYRRLELLGQPLLARQVGKACHIGLELQLHRARRSVPLLADNHFGFAVHGIHVGGPLLVFRRARSR